MSRAAVCLLALVALVASSADIVPLFAWTNSEAIRFSSPQYLQPFSSRDLSACAQLGADCPLLPATGAAAAPAELLVLAVWRHLDIGMVSRYSDAYASSADGGAFGALKHAVESGAAAGRSVVVPYAELSGAQLPQLVSRVLRAESNSGAALLVAGAPADGAFASVGAVPLAELDRVLAAKLPALLSNGKTDVLVVYFEQTAAPASIATAAADDAQRAQLAAGDRVLAAINTQLAAAAHSPEAAVLTMYTALSGVTAQSPAAAAAMRVARALSADPSTNGTTNGTNGTNGTFHPHLNDYWGAEIIAGVIAGLFLFFVLLFGVHLTHQVQGPQYFETVKKTQ